MSIMSAPGFKNVWVLSISTALAGSIIPLMILAWQPGGHLPGTLCRLGDCTHCPDDNWHGCGGNPSDSPNARHGSQKRVAGVYDGCHRHLWPSYCFPAITELYPFLYNRFYAGILQCCALAKQICCHGGRIY